MEKASSKESDANGSNNFIDNSTTSDDSEMLESHTDFSNRLKKDVNVKREELVYQLNRQWNKNIILKTMLQNMNEADKL